MVVSDKHKYFYVFVPKGGTHTMYHLLTTYCNGERHGGFHHFLYHVSYGRRKI